MAEGSSSFFGPAVGGGDGEPTTVGEEAAAFAAPSGEAVDWDGVETPLVFVASGVSSELTLPTSFSTGVF